MEHPLESLRALLASHLRAKELAHLGYALAQSNEETDEPDPIAQRSADRARRALGTGEARGALESAVSAGIVDASNHGAFLSHLAQAARIEVREHAALQAVRPTAVRDGRELRATLAEWTRDLMDSGDPKVRNEAASVLAHSLDDQRAARIESNIEAQSFASKIRARGPSAPDDAPADLAAIAERFLRETHDAMIELHDRTKTERSSWADVLAGSRHASVEPLVPPRDRARRWAASLAPLGLERPLARVRMITAHGLLTAEAVTAHDERGAKIARSPFELRLISELALGRAAGRAAARMWVSRALPIELSRSPEETVPRAIGELMTHWLGDRHALGRMRELGDSELSALRYAASREVVLRARVLAARVLIQRVESTSRSDIARGRIVEASGARDGAGDRGLFDPAWGELEHVDAAFRAAYGALAIDVAMRERFDADWQRNPRASTALGSAMERGGSLSVEAWASELSVQPEMASERVRELAS